MTSMNKYKTAWEKVSVKLSIIGITILGILATFPDHFLTAWAIYSPNFLSVIPVHVIPYISIGLLILKVLKEIITAQIRHDLEEKKEELEKQLIELQAQQPAIVKVEATVIAVDNSNTDSKGEQNGSS